MFEQEYEKYQSFLSENFPFFFFFGCKISIYLNRRVFVMDQQIAKPYAWSKSIPTLYMYSLEFFSTMILLFAETELEIATKWPKSPVACDNSSKLKNQEGKRCLSIKKTCLYNFDPLIPHFYIVKLRFQGVYIIFLISAQKHRLWVLVRTASTRRF